MKKQLEDLPNELLWLILEYISPIDLFYTFLNLNQRFNKILRLTHCRLNLLYTNKDQFNYYLNTILPNIEINRIESFHIDDINSRLDSIHIYKNLHSLTIHYLRTENIDLLATNILPELKQLHSLRLHSQFILKDEDINSLTNVLFSEQIPSLIYCYLGFQDFGCMSFDHLKTTNKALALKTLVIDQWCRLKDFIRLLHFIPNIRHLTVRLFDSHPKGMIIPSLTTIDDFTILVPHLIYLRAKLSQISLITATKILFNRLPCQLRQLSLSSWSIDYANSDSWENILSLKFPNLKHFRLIISLDRIPVDYTVTTNTDLDNIIKPFNQSKYFHDHNWNISLNVNERDRLKFVLHTIPYPIENFQTTLYNIRRCTISSSVVESIYRYVTRLTLTLHDDLTPLKDNKNEYRKFSNVNELIFLSNLTSDCQQFSSIEYFNNVKNIINLSNITSLDFPEETHQYPIQLINILLKNLPQLHSLILSHRSYICLQTQSMDSLKTLTLIFAIYSSISPLATRLRHLVPSTQILTNEIILELVRIVPLSFPKIQTLTLVVRDLDVFDNQFSEWLESQFSIKQNISYELLINDKLIRFHF
ncbi:unnamed protein product [Adineta steineri]|uniref:F-box domain-containing protein n=1 Tax=Adineta steineri TaxID=433720 RepID=A0A814GZN5_9BILA|nr:unnamed protein product [Adineta steineri]CAF3870386.1 unnamed protein product [Adineta steineri]